MDYISANVDLESLYNEIKCNADTIYRFNGVWEGPNPLAPIVPLFLVQLTIAVVFTRLLIVALAPFNQPPFVAEILAGILLGPSVFGRFDVFKHMLFPTYYLQVLEPMAHYALVFYAFLMGLQMDVRAILRTGTHSIHVAVAGIFIPMFIGACLYFIVSDDPSEQQPQGAFFWAAALSVTGFSVLAKILGKQKILLTEIGKTALASALLSDMASWLFLVLGLAMTVKDSIWIILCTLALVLLCASYVRPALNWVVRKLPAGQGYSEYYICSLISGVAVMGVITDLCGTHPMIGAFLFGLIIPNDVLEAVLLDKLGDFVNGMLMPVFFLVCGIRTNLDVIGQGTGSLIKVAMVVILSFAAKIIGTVTVAYLHNSDTSEAVAVGILTNTKSTVALVILEIGVTQGALTTKTFSLMMVAILVMTMVVTPATILYRPSKNLTPYKRRTIQKARSDEELRVLTCLYDTKNVPSIINLLEVSNSTQRSPINVFALHLVELIGRASAMLVVHTNTHRPAPRNSSYLEAQTDQILAAFDNYELRSDGVHTQVLTARSAYATMDEDICNIAKDKRATIIILPFHRQETQDGEVEDMNPSAQNVNESVMANAPCSVGILITRGNVDFQNHSKKIVMLFFGGPDDREALAYAWRMSEHPDTMLKVVRFIPSETTTEVEWDPVGNVEGEDVAIQVDTKRDKAMDDEFLNKFKIATVNDSSVWYTELVLNDEEEAVRAIKGMDSENHDLYIVGKGRGVISPLTAGLTDWCDCPELGPIGDLLITSEFDTSVAVLVVQQFIEHSATMSDLMQESESLNLRKDASDEVDFRKSISDNDTFEPFTSFRKRDAYSGP